MKLYSDENFPLRTVFELRKLGHDVLTATDDGRANLAIPDADVVRRASELGRAVITLDRLDFKRLHNQNPIHSGIIICTEDSDRAGQALRISEKLEEFDTLENILVRVYRPSTDRPS